VPLSVCLFDSHGSETEIIFILSRSISGLLLNRSVFARVVLVIFFYIMYLPKGSL
jgi:hypothetical protein